MLFSGALIPAPVHSFSAPRQLLIIADWGQKPLPDDVADLVIKDQKLKVGFAWRPGQKISEKTRQAVASGRLEPVMCLDPEPVMPLVYGLGAVQASSTGFSWPDDIMQAVAAAQQAYRAEWISEPSGLYLRSGLVTPETAAGLVSMAVGWTNVVSSGAPAQLAKKGDMVLVIDNEAAYSDAAQYWQKASSGPAGVSALFFRPQKPLNPSFLSGLAGRLAVSTEIEMILPKDIVAQKNNLPDIAPVSLTPDLSPWLKNPVIWQRLQAARSDIEAYKNSGTAQVSVLDSALGEMLSLYDWDFLKRLNENQPGQEEQLFQAGMENVYRLLKKTIPPQMTEPLSRQSDASPQQSFSLKVSSDGLVFVNSVDPARLTGIDWFEVGVNTKTVIYKVSAGPAPDGLEVITDIYIDMNNKRDAGLTRILPGAEAYLKPQDAWEFAVRFEKGEMKLFRSGRMMPSLVKKERYADGYKAEIPRTLLRGDPTRWGYQVIIMSRKENSNDCVIEDFLCPESLRREKPLEKRPIELRAVRLSR